MLLKLARRSSVLGKAQVKAIVDTPVSTQRPLEMAFPHGFPHFLVDFSDFLCIFILGLLRPFGSRNGCILSGESGREGPRKRFSIVKSAVEAEHEARALSSLLSGQ